MKKILIIEDDYKLNKGIKLGLSNPEYIFSQSYTLEEARCILDTDEFDLILLDVNLPDGNGLQFVQEIRKKIATPIILLTVNNMEMDIVRGLTIGADDYITKPFSLNILRARVSVQLRKNKELNNNIFRSNEFIFDFEKMLFSKHGKLIELSKNEQKLLKLLCDNKGCTLKRAYLIDSLWEGYTEFVDEHALTVVIKRLRDKLEEDPKNPRYIKTIYGIGYKWVMN